MSFQRWSEKIVGNSKEWTDDQRKFAALTTKREANGFCSGYGIDPWLTLREIY